MYNDYFSVFHLGPRRWGVSLALVVVLFVFSAAGTAEQLSLGNFNPAPELPYESTSFEQDALYATAQQLVGDGKEDQALAACKALRLDSSAPWELQRWAALREIQLLTYVRQERAALDLGKAWLRQNPDDPGALEIRVILGQIVAQRMHSGFMATPQEVDEVFADIFNNHDPDSWHVAMARIQYAQKLTQFTSVDRTASVRSAEQLDTASQCLEKRAKDETLSAGERMNAESILQERVLPLLSQARGSGGEGRDRDPGPEVKELLSLLEQGGANAPGGAPGKE